MLSGSPRRRVRHMKKLLLVAAVAGVAAFAWFWAHGLQHWLAIHTGTDNEPGPYYGFWSGFGSDLGEYVIVASLVSTLALHWRTHTCHYTWWCWRRPNHQVGDTSHFICSHHHPGFAPTSAKDAVAALGKVSSQ